MFYNIAIITFAFFDMQFLFAIFWVTIMFDAKRDIIKNEGSNWNPRVANIYNALTYNGNSIARTLKVLIVRHFMKSIL